jgi:outer membrane protein TolC
MRLQQRFRAAFRPFAAAGAAACLFASGLAVSASGQEQAPQTAPPQQVGAPGNVLRIGLDEAVKMAMENNLGIQAERLNPEVANFGVARALAAYAPVIFGGTQKSSSTAPPTDFLQTGVDVTTDSDFSGNGGIRQQVPWLGGRYQASVGGLRATTNAPLDPFVPLLRSNFDFNYTQPLLAGLRIDGFRAAILQSRNQQDVVDIQLRERLTQTSRTVRYAYLALVQAISGLEVAKQSLETSRQQLSNNRRRVEVGTIAQIETVSAEAEVARNEEAVILREGQIDAARDQLRTLIMNPNQPDFWTTQIEPAEQPVLAPQPIDVDAATKNALANRTDIHQLRKQLESADIDIRVNADARLPAVDATFDYGSTGVGGTRRTFGPEVEGGIRPITGSSTRAFGDVLRDVFGQDFRSWSFAINVSYPIGTSQADAALAQARVRRQQAQTSMRELEIEVAREVRDAARQVANSLKRVEATRKARELAERQLEAEEKRVAVGLSDTFRVVQAQRDLAAQRSAELNAVIDYNRALIDFEAVQVVPVR